MSTGNTAKSTNKISNKENNNKKQFNGSNVNKSNYKDVYVVSGLYPAEIRDELVYNSFVLV